MTVDTLPTLLADLSARLIALETGATQLDALEQAVKDALAQYEQAATRLSAARDKAARKMEQAVTRELKPIKLDKARFFARIEPLPPESWSRQGMEQITFLIAANPGQPPAHWPRLPRAVNFPA